MISARERIEEAISKLENQREVLLTPNSHISDLPKQIALNGIALNFYETSVYRAGQVAGIDAAIEVLNEALQLTNPNRG